MGEEGEDGGRYSRDPVGRRAPTVGGEPAGERSGDGRGGIGSVVHYLIVFPFLCVWISLMLLEAP